jgi:hypothetical protein
VRHNTVFLPQQLPADFPVFNLQVSPNENRSHPLNTTLRAMVKIAGDQLAGARNDKAVARKSTCRVNSILVLCIPITQTIAG